MTFEYKHFVTADGSPTLSVGPTWERMHAEEGAFTERQIIYQPVIENAFDTVQEPVFLSLGLGLGYNELLIAFEALRRGQKPAKIVSYESIDSLKEFFTDWLKDSPSELSPVYEEIAGLYSKKYASPAKEAKIFLLKMLNERRLEFSGPVEETVPPESHSILFDAFSPKTCPQLWEPEFLESFFEKASARPCFVATHACNSALKQALKKNGFTLEIHEGFGRKRESLSAYRPGKF